MKTILIEKAEKIADLILDKIMLECNKNIEECGCDKVRNEEEVPSEEVDEQFNLAKAMKDPRILSKAREMVQRSGGRLSLKDAVIRVGGSASRFL